MKKTSSIFFAVSLAFLTLLTGCNKNKVISRVDENALFTLNFGSFEDELNVFDLATVGNVNLSFAMREGFFYIANSQAKKIMELNSYGDLITLFYNEDVNPKPGFVNIDEVVNATKKAVSYPFNKLETIAVDKRKYLYVVDKLPPERQETDPDTNILLSQIILRFDENGNFLDYLGQQGPGGSPFPYIKNIYTTANNEVVVLCLTSKGFVVYWFSTDGYLLYTVPLENSYVPNPYSEEDPDSYFSVGNIIPDYKKRVLYIKADYFTTYIDQASRVQSGIEYNSTLLHSLDVETGIYGDALVIPAYSEQYAEGFATENFQSPYDFLGVTDSNWFFFMISTEEGFNIQMVQGDGQRILQRRLAVDHKENLYHTFSLGNSGIISALMIKKDHASVNWWRTDELIQSAVKN